jgi:hypothetical protein
MNRRSYEQLVVVARLVLAVVGALGLGVFILGGIVASFDQSGDWGTWASLALFLLLAILLSTAIMFWRTWHNPAERSVQTVIVGALTVCGAFVVCFFLVGLGYLVWTLLHLEQLPRH